MAEVRRKQDEKKTEELCRKFQEEVKAQQRKPVKLEDIMVWKSQYKHVESRYRFLILQGPSRYGKTRYAAMLFGLHRSLVIDCSAGKIPDFRPFDPLVHRCVILDEIPLASVMTHKRVIQAPSDEVTLGTSETQMHSYRKFFGRCAFVVTTNRFFEDFQKLDEPDKDWIRKNSHIFLVTDYLYDREGIDEKPLDDLQNGWEKLKFP